MTAPFRPVPNQQMIAFGQRVCAYIGIDPRIVLGDRSFNWSTTGDEYGTVEFKVAIPTDDLIAMFNGEDRKPVPTLYPSPVDVRSAADALLEKKDELTKFQHWTVRQVARGTVITCVGYLRALADDIEAMGR